MAGKEISLTGKLHMSSTGFHMTVNAVEALKVINFYHFTYRQNQLDGVYLIGGGAEIEPLRRLLEETLDLPVLPVDLLIPGGESQRRCAAFAGAIGLMTEPEKEG